MTTMTVLRVVAKREGFRRAGFVFGSQARDVPVDSLTDAQRAAIMRDPMLLTTEVEVEVEGQSDILTEKIEEQTEALTENPNPDSGATSAADPGARATSTSGRKRK